MKTVSLLRLNLLRGLYLLLVAGLGVVIWPSILDPSSNWTLSRSIVVCMLGALSALCVLGLRYPLRMLPLLFFEMGWKVLWMLRVAAPLWSAGRLDEAAVETAFECAIVLVFPFVIPWSYVWSSYVTAPGDPWLKAPPRAVPLDHAQA